MEDAPMTELNPDIGQENDVLVEIILSKTEMQRNRTLRDIDFNNFQQFIMMIPTVEFLGIRITINGELYGYDIPIPEGHRINPGMTQILAGRNEIRFTVFKETNFRMRDAMMR
ncbi:uncharacterized protein LOC144618866 [Crassostrea virginica]